MSESAESEKNAKKNEKPTKNSLFHRIKRLFMVALSTLLIFMVVYYCALFFLQSSAIYPGQHLESRPALNGKFDTETLKIEHEQGESYGYFLKARDASKDNPRPTIVFFHGNAEFADDWVTEFQTYRIKGYNVFIPEYRGYNNAKGKPNEGNIIDDMVTFHELLLQRPEVASDGIIYFGRSLGGGIATATDKALLENQSKHPPAGLVLWSTFKSVEAMAMQFFAPPFIVWLGSNQYDSISHVSQYNRPLLIMHAIQDELIPIKHAKALYKSAPEGNKTYVEYNGGHNAWDDHDPFTDFDLWLDANFPINKNTP